MKTFNLDKNGVNRGGVIGGNIVIMRKLMFGIVGPVVAAPHRYQLDVFGGPLTIDEFRKYGTVDTGKRFEIHACTACDDTVRVSVRKPTNQVEKMSQIHDSRGTNEPLRLKRPKPLKRDENNLEKTLGITRKKMPTSNISTA
jgi:hypothetical protein